MDILKNLSKRERLLLIVAAVAILLAVVYRVVMIPVREKTLEMEKQIDQLAGELAILQRLVAHKNAVDSDYARLLSGLTSSSSDKEEMAAMLSAVEDLASSCSVALVDVKPRQTRDEGWAKLHYVEIKVEADARQLVRFLYRFNALPGAYRVEDMQLARREKSADVLVASLLASKMVCTEELAVAQP